MQPTPRAPNHGDKDNDYNDGGHAADADLSDDGQDDREDRNYDGDHNI